MAWWMALYTIYHSIFNPNFAQWTEQDGANKMLCIACDIREFQAPIVSQWLRFFCNYNLRDTFNGCERAKNWLSQQISFAQKPTRRFIMIVMIISFFASSFLRKIKFLFFYLFSQTIVMVVVVVGTTKMTVTMTMPRTTNDSSDDARLCRLYHHAHTLHCITQEAQ